MPKLRNFALTLLLMSASAVVAEPLSVFKDCDVCPEMVELPLGEFVMGAAADEYGRVRQHGVYEADQPFGGWLKEDEGPQQVVVVDLRFAIGRNEVTYAEWMACIADGGCAGYIPDDIVLKDGSVSEEVWVIGDFPVFYVSYADALTYVAWINKKTGSDSYRLPTEAEWEYAARAGTQTAFPQGNTLTSEQANFSKQLTEFAARKRFLNLIERGVPVEVDEMNAANAWGLRHIVGNAAEVTSSCYTEHLSQLLKSSDWLAAVKTDCPERVARGGSWKSTLDTHRSASRTSVDSETRSSWTGFRVVKTLE